GKAGFMGARYNPIFLTDNMVTENIQRLESIREVDHQQRAALRRMHAQQFSHDRRDPSVASHNIAYERVRGLMASEKLFDIDREPQEIRDHYGLTQFG